MYATLRSMRGLDQQGYFPPIKRSAGFSRGEGAVVQTRNLHAYVANDPVNFTDPLGLLPCKEEIAKAKEAGGVAVCNESGSSGGGGFFGGGGSFGGGGASGSWDPGLRWPRAPQGETEQPEEAGVAIVVVAPRRDPGPGLGDVASTLAQQPNTIYFGYPPDPNARHHIDVHLGHLTAGQRELLRAHIRRAIRRLAPNLAPGQELRAIEIFLGREYQYRAYGLPGNVTNIGTVFDVTE